MCWLDLIQKLSIPASLHTKAAVTGCHLCFSRSPGTHYRVIRPTLHIKSMAPSTRAALHALWDKSSRGRSVFDSTNWTALSCSSTHPLPPTRSCHVPTIFTSSESASGKQPTSDRDGGVWRCLCQWPKNLINERSRWTGANSAAIIRLITHFGVPACYRSSLDVAAVHRPHL